MKIYNKVSEMIGKTPIIKLNKFGENIYAKCEYLNPSHSVKDRAAYWMLKSALESGKINQDSTIIEATSGNTGIALSMICADLGLKIIITMPETMSLERRAMMQFFGAKLELTPASASIKGSIERAKELNASIPNSFIPSQFTNLANKNAHRESTALEIIESFGGVPDVFVAGFGTGGTISGVGEILKEKNPNVKIIAIEPLSSPLLSKGEAAPHKIQGIGANIIPEILNKSVIDEILTISNEDAINTARELARTSGLMVGISSGANAFGARLMAQKFPGKKVLTMLNDTAERYLSTDLFAFDNPNYKN